MDMSDQHHTLATLLPGDNTQYPLYMTLDGPQSWFLCGGKGKNPPARNQISIFHPDVCVLVSKVFVPQFFIG
jgi:hypothetical protein